MTNETFEQMAERVWEETLVAGGNGEHIAPKFATRLRAEWLKQCAVGSHEAFVAKYGERGARTTFAMWDLRRQVWDNAFQAGAASQQQHIAELENELARIQKASLDALGIGLVDVAKFPFVAMKE